MAQPENNSHWEITPCAQCGKDVPLFKAKVAEAVDYVAYFCGLQCYAKWAAQAATPELPSSKADAPTLNLTLTDASGNVAANELKLEHLDAALDEALMQSFPASDPIAINFSCAVVSNSSQHVATTVTTPTQKTSRNPNLIDAQRKK